MLRLLTGPSSAHKASLTVDMPPRSRGLGLPLTNTTLNITLTTRPNVRPLSPFICQTCRLSLRPRTFSTTPLALKKSSANKKSARKTPEVSSPDVARHVPDNKATASRDAEIDPYDFSTLQADIDRALARLRDALTKTRDAGRVSAQMIEELPVEINVKGGSTSGGSAHKERTRVGDIASVVPKGGRAMNVFVSEESFLKPVTAAIQASPYSLTPQAASSTSTNPLMIEVPVPPVTAETRAQAANEAKKCTEKASLEVRTARGEAQKVFRRMELEKLVIKDELHKAHKGMEEVVKKGQEEVKRFGDAAVKALER